MFLRKMSSKIDVKLGVKSILTRVNAAYALRDPSIKTSQPILVAVSKTKPAELILDAYSTGQRDFGENYVQELQEKCSSSLILEQCEDIRWHFIGHLQRSNVKKLSRNAYVIPRGQTTYITLTAIFQVLKTPGIYMIETIDSEKIAEGVNSSWANISSNKEPLKVLVQVNTSNEEEKSGVTPAEVMSLRRYIFEKCIHLKLEGLMTIGKFGHDYSTGPNPDFICLMKCHKEFCEEFNLTESYVSVSMGMSDDFEDVIKMGSTIVRVGSSIFGYRVPKKA